MKSIDTYHQQIIHCFAIQGLEVAKASFAPASDTVLLLEKVEIAFTNSELVHGHIYQSYDAQYHRIYRFAYHFVIQ